ncbi:FAD-dependent monooxygenase [Candidatus Pelagibacter sp.]|nr:FAD-dependent monooxygenase [Candidatus Pelagibacter sp.]
MKICIIGDGLVSLTLANVLIKKEILVDILINRKSNRYDKIRTLGISKSNIDYFNNKIINIEKNLWKIKNIKILTENSPDKEILDFGNNKKQIFSIIKNYKLYEILNKNLKKSKFVKFQNFNDYEYVKKKKYKLIINCDFKNEITKKFFSNNIEKNYHSNAYTTVINHKKILKNDIAYQNFTDHGPIAFLPVSNTQTSIVYSFRKKNANSDIDIKDLIKKYNPKYSILKINDLKCMKLKSSSLRKYYKNNILAFGDLLHKIHPLAGQGFNMSIRDIKLLSELIDQRIKIGLDINSSICKDFQKKAQDKNYIFSSGVDLIYELFHFEAKIKSKLLSKSINIIGKNKFINSFFKKFADTGFRV